MFCIIVDKVLTFPAVDGEVVHVQPGVRPLQLPPRHDRRGRQDYRGLSTVKNSHLLTKLILVVEPEFTGGLRSPHLQGPGQGKWELFIRSEIDSESLVLDQRPVDDGEERRQ